LKFDKLIRYADKKVESRKTIIITDRPCTNFLDKCNQDTDFRFGRIIFNSIS